MNKPNPQSAPLWQSDDIRQAVSGTGGGTGGGDFVAFDVAIDSRSIKAGDLFIALKGPNHDGHDFVKQALDAGAAGCIVHQDNLGERCIKVADTMAALVALGQAGRKRARGKIIAITGSVGKTGSKDALYHMLQRQGQTYATKGSFNNHWGAPLSLAQLPPTAHFGIFELGMNHAGELAQLSPMVQPHIVLITTVEAVHLAHFANVAAIAEAKAEIFTGLTAGGTAILNADNPFFARLRDVAAQHHATNIWGFGESAGAQAQLISYQLQAQSSTVCASFMGQELSYDIGAPGRHWVQNSLAVLLAAKAAGADIALAAQSLAHFTPPAGRGQQQTLRLPQGTITLIDESYNASPVSMRAALDLLKSSKPTQGSKRIAVLGDMLELGFDATSFHTALLPSIGKEIDMVFTCGPLMHNLFLQLPKNQQGMSAPDALALLPHIEAALQSGDVIMIKSSKGTGTSKIVAALQAKNRKKD